MKESGITIMLRERIELQGQSISKVSRDTGISRNTIRKYLREGEQEHGLKGCKRPSKLDPYKTQIDELIASGIYNAEVIYTRIVAKGYSGKVTIIKDYLRPRRPVTVTQGPAVQRYETKPGRQVQMDWGICNYIDPNGQHRKTACFVMVLGFSRVRYIEFCKRSDLRSLLRCIVNAFEYFGGVPQMLLTDRMKTVILQMDQRQATWQADFEQFAAELGFVPKVCRVRRPQTKGKVERLVDYVKDNFLPGRSFTDLQDLNNQARYWMAIVNNKIHGTTGLIPLLQLAQEKLQPLPEDGRHEAYRWEKRKVSMDCFVSYDGVRYGVKWRYCRQEVLVKRDNNHLMIALADGELIQEHQVCHDGRRYVYAKGQYEGLVSHQGKPHTPSYARQILYDEVQIRNLDEYAAMTGVISHG